MPSLAVSRMTEEQKETLLDAAPEAIVCVVERSGDLFCGLVKVYRAPNVCGKVARTEMIYNDDAEAMDAALDIVSEIQDSVLKPERAGKVVEVEVTPDDETDEVLEAELDGMLKDAIEENEADAEK